MRTGVLGGTYNPVHHGHLILAESVREEAGLDRILLIPAYISPFKRSIITASADDRLEMLRLAVNNNDKIDISDIEIKAEGVSYTINTLNTLKDQLPDDEIYFVCGSDAFSEIESWYEHNLLLKRFSFIVGMRPGSSVHAAKQTAERISEKYGTEISIVATPQIDISSTQIRANIAAQRSIRYLLPESVEEYIYKKGLYKQQ